MFIRTRMDEIEYRAGRIEDTIEAIELQIKRLACTHLNTEFRSGIYYRKVCLSCNKDLQLFSSKRTYNDAIIKDLETRLERAKLNRTKGQ